MDFLGRAFEAGNSLQASGVLVEARQAQPRGSGDPGSSGGLGSGRRRRGGGNRTISYAPHNNSQIFSQLIIVEKKTQ